MLFVCAQAALVLLTQAGGSERLQQALALEQSGDDRAAVSALTALASEQPRWELPRLELARIQLKLGQVDQAQAQLEAVRALAPDNPRANFYWAAVMEERSRPWDAIRALERAVSLREDYWDARFRLAGLCLSVGDLLKAELHYRALAKARPEMINVRLQLVDVLEKQGRLDDAESELRHLLAEQPRSPAVIRKLAAFLERTGRPELAAKMYKRLDEPAAQKKMRALPKSRR